MIGVIMLDTNFPRPVGDIGNPETFGGNAIYETVHGASPKRVVVEQDPMLLEPFIKAGERLVLRGATVLTTSCGFLANFQDAMQASLSVPVYTSSLLLVPELEKEHGEGRVGILTIDKDSLNRALKSNLGVSKDAPINSPVSNGKFASAILGNQNKLDQVASEREIVAAACQLVTDKPLINALVLECTNMPPYARAIGLETGRPIHSLVSFLSSKILN